jgi:ribosomal protein S18 acetylase RimI-like enzyme
MDNIDFKTILDPATEVERPIHRGLHNYNLAHLGEDTLHNYARLAIVAHNEAGDVIGGIVADLIWEWLYIDVLWVDDAYRGQGIGSRLLAMAEEIAVSKGFCNAHLETTDFQAFEFYKKRGYEVFGTLEGKPSGHTWFYIKKALG